MPGFTDVFGGSTVQPSDVQFASVALSASILTYWPEYATTGQVMARIMKVSASAASLTISLPNATLVSGGQDVLFDNSGAETFTVLDFSGATIATVAAGAVRYFYLSDNSTSAGTWRTTLFGVGSSALDASQLAGYGLKVVGNTLNTGAVTTTTSSNTTITASDQSKIFIWTGGSGTFTLPTTVGSTSNFAIEIRNQGTGTLTVATVGGVLIDASATITLSVQESCFVHMGPTDWYTVGRGRNTAFNFTQLTKAITGGTTVLTLTEASNVVQKYTGALVSNATITLPAVVQVYYVSNETTGAYTLTFDSAGGGTSIAVTQAQAAILFSDGTNIINANTSLDAGIASIIFGAGTVTNPSVAIATASTGFYSSGSNEIGITCNGVYVGKWTSAGLTAVGAISAASITLTTDLAVADGGTGRSTGTTAYSLVATGTTATGAQQTLANGATTEILVGGGAAALPVWTTATGTGAPVRATSPVLVTPALGTPSSGVVTNLTGTASININGTVGATTPAAVTATTLTATGNAALGDAEATDTHAIKGATTVLANSASAALTVTQTGSGNAFVVEDSASTDSTPVVIDASGRVIVGYTAAQTSTLLGYAKQQTVGIDTHSSQNAVWNFANDNGPSWVALYKSRGAIGVNTIVQDDDAIGRLGFFAADGSDYIRAAQISAEVDGTPGVSSMPTRLEFSTTASGDGQPTTRAYIDSTGRFLLVSPAGLGYGTGAGGTVTQATSKSTAVTLNTPCGKITMNNAALADATTVVFGFNNTNIADEDVVSFTCDGGFGANYLVWGVNPSAGAISVAVRNVSGVSQSQALVLNFVVLKGATA